MSKTAVIIGAGPGLGMSIAHRFGREGYTVALVSRSDARHAAYLASLAEQNVKADAFTADVRDRGAIGKVLDTVAEQYGSIDLLYYGPGAADLDNRPKPITETDSAAVQAAMSWVYPAVDVVATVLPGMIARGSGGLLFAGGISAVMPMPGLGNLAVSSAALRNYALTLNAAVAEHGLYAGILTIGGLIERGDIYQLVRSQPEQFGDVAGIRSLNPDELADAAWELFTQRDRPEATFNVFA